MRPTIKDRRRACDCTDWRKPAAEDNSDREHRLRRRHVWTPLSDRGGGVDVLVGVYANDDVHGYGIGHCEHLQAGCTDLAIGGRTGL